MSDLKKEAQAAFDAVMRATVPLGRQAASQAMIEPEPLRAALPPSERYPVEALGTVLGTAALAINQSVQAPLAMCCQSVLAAASLAVQTHFDVKLPWGEIKPLSLFLLTVGESGERKSAVDNLALGEAKAREKENMKNYEMAIAEFKIDVEAWNQAKASEKKTSKSKREVVTAGLSPSIAGEGDEYGQV